MADYHRILSRKNNQLCEEGCQTPTLPPSLPPLPSPFFGDEHPARRLTNFLLIAAAIFAASLLLSLTYYAVLRRRRRPLGVAAAVPAPDDDDAASLEEGEPFHHVWYIRTVGLDESTIGSIAVTEYRAGDGLLDGVSDCSVCLGDFREGERVRLLPKCGHAFHVPCIDTWLQAHVNCPLCRAHIVDPDAEPGPPTASDAALPITAAGESMELDSGSSALVETLQIGIQPLEEEGHQQQQNERRSDSLIEIGIPSNPSHVFDSLPESSVSRLQSDLVRCGLQPVRRSFSMDTPMMHSIVIRMEPEEGTIDEEGKDPNFEEEIGPKNREKQGNSSKGVVDGKDHSSIGRSLSSSGRGFFFSRNGWAARIHSMPM